MRIHVTVLLLTLALFSPSLFYAAEPTTTRPDMATGMVAYTAFGGVRENINYSNGNLNLQIPLVTLPGRNGHDLTVALVYDSKMWTLVGEFLPMPPPSGTIQWRWVREDAGFIVGGGGWRFNVPYLYAQGQESTRPCHTSYVAILPDGSKHSFLNGGEHCVLVSDSQDGAFIRLRTTQPESEAVLYMKNGTRIHFPLNGTSYGVASKVVDPNGNIISYAKQADGSLQITVVADHRYSRAVCHSGKFLRSLQEFSRRGSDNLFVIR